MSDGVLQSGKGMIETKAQFTDFQLHVEFATPKDVKGDSQGRGNSGVFLLGKFEMQVLDSYNNPTYPDGQASAMYGQYPPLVNASRPPGEWQAYDIVFTAPRFTAAGKLDKPAVVTVIHNGIVVHNATRVLGSDGAQGHQPVRAGQRRRVRSGCRITATRCAFAISGSGRSRRTADENRERATQHTGDQMGINRRRFLAAAGLPALAFGASGGGRRRARGCRRSDRPARGDGLGLTPAQYAALLTRLLDEKAITPDSYSLGGIVEELEARVRAASRQGARDLHADRARSPITWRCARSPADRAASSSRRRATSIRTRATARRR